MDLWAAIAEEAVSAIDEGKGRVGNGRGAPCGACRGREGVARLH